MSVLALDGGGTMARLAIAAKDGRILHCAVGNGVNPMDNANWRSNFDGLLATAGDILQTVEASVFGMPGFGEVKTIDAAIAECVGAYAQNAMRLVNDVELAHYAAFDGAAGVLILAGTGSMVIAGGGETDMKRIGGWGDELGDEGSAFWIGRTALVLAGRMIDGRSTRQPFVELLLDRLGIDDRSSPLGLLDWYYSQGHRRSACAAIARHIDAMAQGRDETATSILNDAAHHLFEQAAAGMASIGEHPLPWSHAGGVFSSAFVCRAVEKYMGATPLKPNRTPIEGGLAWAARALGWPVDDAWTAQIRCGLAAA